jgi:hypothetical protein
MKTRTSFIAKDTRFTFDETPIEIGTIECVFEVECSVQEMAQGGSTLMNVMKFVKDSIKEAQASSTPKEITKHEEPAELPTGTFTGGEPIGTKPEFRLNLKGSFEVLESKLISTDEQWESDGYGNISWKGEGPENKEIQISLDKKCIDMHFYGFASEPVHIHVYEDRTSYSGIAGIYAEKFFKNLGVPGADEIFKMLSKVKEAD